MMILLLCAVRNRIEYLTRDEGKKEEIEIPEWTRAACIRTGQRQREGRDELAVNLIHGPWCTGEFPNVNITRFTER
jgi:hypothetical protein